MKDKVYKWLPIIFGCHRREDRSFHYKGKQFPICARCTGELFGILLGLFTYPFAHINGYMALFILLPMIFDGFLQSLTKYESTNFRRFLTGLLFGYGLATLFMLSTVWTFNFGYNFTAHK